MSDNKLPTSSGWYTARSELFREYRDKITADLLDEMADDYLAAARGERSLP